MTLHLLSLDFHHTPLVLREKLAFPAHTLPAALHALREWGASEAVILSTCNRVELIVQLPFEQDSRMLVEFLGDWHGLATNEVRHCARAFRNEDAARHLIRVACGLESLVPGEMQILGQVREAAAVARQSDMLGPDLDRVLAFAISAGRRARRETGISRRPVSIAHAAVALVQAHFGGELSGRKVLLVGSGKIGELAAQQLHRAGASHFIVANRTLERACSLAQRWNGIPLLLDELPTALMQVDAVIAATTAPHYIFHCEELADVMEQREGQELLMVDLAVPRDIDPRATEVPGVLLSDIDALQEVVAENIALRDGEREAVERIVEEELDRLLAEQAVRAVAPTIVNLRRSAEEIRQAELAKVLARLNHLSEQEQAVIEAMSRALVNKLLHQPTVHLREKAVTEEGPHLQRTIEALFGLSGDNT
jgi:glutamyl-tRNA reductase